MSHPLKQTTPPGYDEPVNALQYQGDEMRLCGGWRGYLKRLLPQWNRDEMGWRIFGPRWSTRTCGADDERSLFMVARWAKEFDVDGRWELRGPSR